MDNISDKKQKSEKRKNFINILLATFAICIVVFTVIGALVVDNFSTLQQVEDLTVSDDDDFKGEIDDRLRFIAMQEDEMANSDKTPEEKRLEEGIFDENNVLNEPEEIADFLANEEVKKSKFEEYNEKYRKKQYNDNLATEDESADVPFTKDVAISPNDVTLKVVIGDFESKEAAQKKLEEIRSQFSASPFIKNIGGRYALQVGSFKTRATADEFVSSLKQQGYSVRIIEE